MRAEGSGSKKRWSAEEKKLLIKVHGELEARDKSHQFFDDIKTKFPSRTIASIEEECRRLSLKPKRNPRSENCEHCGEKIESERIGNYHKKCYHKKYYIDSKQ